MRQRHFIALAFLAAFAGAAPAATAPQRGPVVREALATVGAKYRYGGASPATGFDCSGLVTHVYKRAWGLTLPRNTAGQRHAGRAVNQSQLVPGDLVFYNTKNQPYSHVGIYIGNGKFVHAPRPGEHVRVDSIHAAYWRAHYNGARRLDPPA